MENSGVYKRIEDLLSQDQEGELIARLINLIDPSEQERILPHLIRFLSSKSLVFPCLNRLIREEIDQTLSEGTLFRRNSAATRMATALGRGVGGGYLKTVLGPVLSDICGNNAADLEVDPAKMNTPSPEQLSQSQLQLKAAADRVVKAIFASIPLCPPDIRDLCKTLKEETEKKFSGSETTVVGGFVFLRFFVPAITAPDGFGVLKTKLSPAGRRALVLIAKLVQNLANNVEFGAKEPFLTPLNAFVTENQGRMKRFLEELAAEMTESEREEQKKTTPLRENLPFVSTSSDVIAVANCLHRIHAKLRAERAPADHPLGALCRFLEDYSPPLSALIKAEGGGEMTMDRISSLAKKALLTCAEGHWQYADTVGNVRVFFSDADVDVVDVKAEIVLHRSPLETLDTLWNLDRRQKWDPLVNNSMKLAHQISPYLRVMHTSSSPQTQSGILSSPRSFIYAEWMHISKKEEKNATSGSIVMFGDVPAQFKPQGQDEETAFNTLIPAVLAPSGFIVSPRTAENTAKIEYILRVGLGGEMEREDVWSAAIEMALSLGKLEKLLEVEEEENNKKISKMYPPQNAELRTENRIQATKLDGLQWEEDGFLTLSCCGRQRCHYFEGHDGEMAFRGTILVRQNVAAAGELLWSTKPNEVAKFDTANCPALSLIHVYSPSERIVDIEFEPNEYFVTRRIFRLYRSMRKGADGSIEIVSNSISWNVNDLVVGLRPDAVFARKMVDVIRVIPHVRGKAQAMITRMFFSIGGGDVPAVVWNRVQRKWMETSMQYLETTLGDPM